MRFVLLSRTASAAAAATPSSAVRLREKVRCVTWLTRFVDTVSGSPDQRFDCPLRYETELTRSEYALSLADATAPSTLVADGPI